MNHSLAPHKPGSLQTPRIQAAIDLCAAEGGGTITLQSGEFLTGSLQLRSKVQLFLEPGAVLKGSDRLEDYPPLDFDHNEFGETRSLIWAMGEDQISICGTGTVDFSGTSFMHLDQPDDRGPGGKDLHLLPESLQSEAVVRAKDRPNQPIFFHECTRIRVDHIHLIDAPCWTLTLSVCDGVKVRGVSVRNSLVVPNCDGVNISSSRNVIVDGCDFHCADDCVAVVGITRWETPAENIIISNCTMVSRSCGVRLGFMSSTVRNVHVHHLILSDGNRGLGIFAGDGGCVENIQADHLIFHTHLFAGFWWGMGEPLCLSAADSTGIIRNVRISDVTATSEGSVVVAGDADQVQDITLENWDLTLRAGIKRDHLENWIDLQPGKCRKLEKSQFPWMYREGIRDLHLQNLRVHDEEVAAKGFSTKEIQR